MSGWSESETCPRCGVEGALEAFGDRYEVGGNCLECGYSYGIKSSIMPLENVNVLRTMAGMQPLEKFREPQDSWDDTIRLSELPLPTIEHVYDCKGHHYIRIGSQSFGPALYEHAAFAVCHNEIFVAFTPYYEGTLEHDSCQGVYRLQKVGDDAKNPSHYDAFNAEERCPYIRAHAPCELPTVCPQKEEPECE